MKPNASRRRPQKRRQRGVGAVTEKEWVGVVLCDLETVAAEEVGEKERESVDFILERERERERERMEMAKWNGERKI